MTAGQTPVGPHSDADQLLARRRALVAQALIDPAAAGAPIAGSPGAELGDIGGNTFFESLCGVSFDPDHAVLSAVVLVRQSFGYLSGPCGAGSTEYVRFYIDWLGDGNWDDQGVAALPVFDIQDQVDCREQLNKPIGHAVALAIDPRHACCDRPLTPKVRAILSWQLLPPPNTPDYLPVWGEWQECAIQMPIRDCDWIPESVELAGGPGLDLQAGLDLKLPPLPPFPPRPLPWPPTPPWPPIPPIPPWPRPCPGPDPVPFGELLRRYHGDGKLGRSIQVPLHRSGFNQLAKAKGHPGLAQAGAHRWKGLGQDWGQAAGQLIATTWDTTFESLCCIGWDPRHWHFLAEVEVKLEWGYSGDLCEAGSTEYVAFWLDLEDRCEWVYLDTVAVAVHDIDRNPEASLCYSARLPWKLPWSPCKEARTARLRAVLSWGVPPSTVDPYAPVHWGDAAEVAILPPTYHPQPKDLKVGSAG